MSLADALFDGGGINTNFGDYGEIYVLRADTDAAVVVDAKYVARNLNQITLQLAAVPVVDNGIYLFVDGLQDPGNLGALIRIGEGFGAVALILGHGTVHPNHPRALRASAGSRLRTLTVVDITPDELESHLSPGAPRWAVLTPRGGQLLTEVPSGGSLILAVGAEGPGISDEVAARADIRLTIPLAGKVESLNSTVAAAIALYEISRTEPLL